MWQMSLDSTQWVPIFLLRLLCHLMLGDLFYLIEELHWCWWVVANEEKIMIMMRSALDAWIKTHTGDSWIIWRRWMVWPSCTRRSKIDQWSSLRSTYGLYHSLSCVSVAKPKTSPIGNRPPQTHDHQILLLLIFECLLTIYLSLDLSTNLVYSTFHPVLRPLVFLTFRLSFSLITMIRRLKDLNGT